MYLIQNLRLKQPSSRTHFFSSIKVLTRILSTIKTKTTTTKRNKAEPPVIAHGPRGGQSGREKRQRKFPTTGGRGPGMLKNQFHDSFGCFSLIGHIVRDKHLWRCFPEILIRRSLPAKSTECSLSWSSNRTFFQNSYQRN